MNQRGREYLIWVLWEFGDELQFKKLARSMAHEADSNGQDLLIHGVKLCDMHLPPELFSTTPSPAMVKRLLADERF